MATSNKLLLGLLITVLLFITVVLSIGKYLGIDKPRIIIDQTEAPAPPTPPAVPEAPAAPVPTE